MQYEERACASTLGSSLRLGLCASRLAYGAYGPHWVMAALLLLSTALSSTPLLAQEAQIRKNLPARLPGFPAVDRVIKTPHAGLYEVNVGTEVYYTDAEDTGTGSLGRQLETKCALTKADFLMFL